ncbi:hypothetical protein ACFFLZ_05320 [Photobacterium aphoticum]|uniref:Uncharacterized protein n=1 Tax=Photobacterium aphoticum TaxID=754436 RepID=A0A0J1GQY8_9GAMM|nr:hypothetical protein [Photobacterium aphoticum]KLV01824.1 hypothetical protein ABT58_05225 [Photobacterium aphoticum]PSU58686.1 hypothetical protein C9I90_05535 [Photobacterium aphoticum]GHA32775.1 hypothetical protein GCM10007086_02460 [Photobacterium aphoticum]
MSNNRVWSSVSIFETGLSAAEWIWRIVTIVFIGGSGTLTALLAKADPVLKELGVIYWVAIGIITSLIVILILYLFKTSILKQSEADLNRILSTPKNTVNPLSESFKDLVIPVEDLRLPRLQLHENKHFKRCKFVGPASICILGGTYNRGGFHECGDIIALPEDVYLTGIIVLKNCTVEDCEFIRTTVFTDQNTARGFLNAFGSQVKGIIDKQHKLS